MFWILCFFFFSVSVGRAVVERVRVDWSIRVVILSLSLYRLPSTAHTFKCSHLFVFIRFVRWLTFFFFVFVLFLSFHLSFLCTRRCSRISWWVCDNMLFKCSCLFCCFACCCSEFFTSHRSLAASPSTSEFSVFSFSLLFGSLSVAEEQNRTIWKCICCRSQTKLIKFMSWASAFGASIVMRTINFKGNSRVAVSFFCGLSLVFSLSPRSISFSSVPQRRRTINGTIFSFVGFYFSVGARVRPV